MKIIFTLSITLLFIVGCGASRGSARIIEKMPQSELKQVTQEQNVPQIKLPTPPKRTFKAKEVEDTNPSDTYMYPEDSAAAVKDVKVVIKPDNTSPSMSKSECIAMISQEKFDKYSTMFGSEAASLKRCTMLKAMK